MLASIIGILAAIAVPNYQWGIIKAKEAVLRETLYNFRNTIDQFYADQGKYPDSIDELKQKQYMREIPKDPFTGSNTTWETVEPPPPRVQPRVLVAAVPVLQPGVLTPVKFMMSKADPTRSV